MLIIFYSIGLFLLLSSKQFLDKDYLKITAILGIAGLLFASIGLFNFHNFLFDRHNTLLGDRVFDSEFAVCLLSFFIFARTPKRVNTNIYSILFALSGSVIFTYIIDLRTRAAYVALAVIGVCFLYFLAISKDKTILNNKLIAVLTFSLIIALSLSFSLPDSNNERKSVSETIYSVFDKDYSTNKIRLHFWKASLKMFAENSIFGIGERNWAGLYPIYNGGSYSDDNVDMNSAINPHNDYIEVLTEFGIVGFVIFTGFIFTGLYFLFKKSKNNIVYLPFFLSALGLSTTMFFSFTKDNYWAMIVFSLCMAVGYSNNSQYRFQNSTFYIKYKKHIKTIALAFGIIMLVLGIWFKLMSYFNEKVYFEAMNLKAQRKYGEMLVKLDKVSDYFYPVDINKMPVDYYRGVGYFELKQYDKALEKFRSARSYMKYYPTIMNNEASALYMSGKIYEAEQLFLEITNLFPNYIEPQINLLALYTNINKFSEAKKILLEIERKSFNEKYVKNYSVFLRIKNYLTENQK